MDKFLADSCSNLGEGQNGVDLVKILEEFFLSDFISIDLNKEELYTHGGGKYLQYNHLGGFNPILIWSLKQLCYAMYSSAQIKKIMVCDNQFFQRLISNEKILQRLNEIQNEGKPELLDKIDIFFYLLMPLFTNILLKDSFDNRFASQESDLQKRFDHQYQSF